MGVVAAIALAAACTSTDQASLNPTQPTATTTTDFGLMFANFKVGPSSTFDVHLFAESGSGETFLLASDSPLVTVPPFITTDDKHHGLVVAQMHDVTVITRVTITAKRNEKHAVASVTLYPPASLTTEEASVIGGKRIRVAYTPSQPSAKSRIFWLTIAVAGVSTESFVELLPENATFITLDVPTPRVAAKTTVTLSVEAAGEVTSTVNVELLPEPLLAHLGAFSVVPPEVRGGEYSTGIVTLSSAAPPEGTVVTLRSGSREFSVPATLGFASGETTRTFLIETRPPYADTTVTITATVQNESRTATLVVETVPPVAQNDSATIDAQLTLSVPAPGVLSNDLSPSGRPLTAELVRSVAHGTMILEANGAFSYQPTRGFSGQDTFTYRPYDGPVKGNLATVTITVLPAPVLPTPVDPPGGTGPIIRLVMSGSDDFGLVSVGHCQNGTMNIFNDGDAALTWTSITSTNTDFSIISGGNGTRAAGAGFAAVTVRFCPTALGAASSTLSVVSNKASGTSTKVVRGTGI